MRLTMQQRQAVVAKAAGRYQRSGKKEKGLILTELVELTEYSRVYARRVLRQHGKRIKQGQQSLVASTVTLIPRHSSQTLSSTFSNEAMNLISSTFLREAIGEFQARVSPSSKRPSASVN